MAKKQIRDLLRALPSDGRFRMADVDPDSTPGLKHHKRAFADLEAHRAALFDLQERLYAEHKRSLLIVLQGMDGSGKDGTITHVIGNLNPQGVLITPFTDSCGAFARGSRRRARSASSTGRTTRTC